MLSIFDIHTKLGLNLENGLFIRKSIPISVSFHIQEMYEGDFSAYKSNYKVEYVLKKLQPQSFFLFNNEPLILFFDFSKKIEKKVNEKLSKDIWNFNKSAIIFVNTPYELSIYNGFKFEKSGVLKLLDVIKSIKDEHKLKEYSYWKIINSELWINKDVEFKKKSRVDIKLLENIRSTRDILIDNTSNVDSLSEKHANRVIGRLIFVRYLIDREVNLDYNGDGKELLSKERLPELILQKDKLYEFFEYLLNRFKGNILPLNGEYESVTFNHLSVLSNLFAGDEIKTNQKSFFNIFDFDFIPIELISNIYETFLGEKQDKEKAFYTPPFLVDYVLEQTVKPFILSQTDFSTLSCVTVDFTCGSGIFLCETLRTLINRFIEIENPDKSSSAFKTKMKEFVKNNIYGNDVNLEAIEIAKFSLFITLLDYFEDPKDIEGFEFPEVSNNFFNYDVFDNSLDKIFGNNGKIKIDFILGNPPWGKVKGSRYLEYIKEREAFETDKQKLDWINKNKSKGFNKVDLGVGNKEFAQAFLFRLSDFSSYNTTCQIIVTSKILYNLQSKGFRNYLLNQFFIKEVLEISSVRHQIFTNAVGPAVIIKFNYAFGSETATNRIDYISLKPNPFFSIFKSILIEKHDYKEVIQKELIDFDWLWKVLVYGHILDFRFVKRLRSREYYSLTLNDLVSDKNESKPLFISTGIIVGNKSNDCSHYKGMYFVDTDSRLSKRPSDLQRYYTHIDKKNTWKLEKAERIRKENVFKEPPTLLIKKGLTPDYKLISSICYVSCVFAQSIYGIKTKKNDIPLLENILGLINSDLMSYYMLLNGSSTGVEREQLINKELLPFPIVLDDRIIGLVKKLLKITRLIEIKKRTEYFNQNDIEHLKSQFNQLGCDLNKLIEEIYKLSSEEKSLLSFSQEITIPVLQSKNKNYKDILANQKLFKPFKPVTENEIEDYINTFKEYFQNLFKYEESKCLNAIIYQSKNIVALAFKLEINYKENIWVNYTENELELIINLGFQKVSKDLFIQKDVKNLSRDTFSVLKLNQYKYWHKAIAYLDVVEFSEAMLKSQIYQ